uniref:C2 domain-containing protein n=1 Tax=Syphacia muris TaxID=451379 RepID=A0A0N5AKF6_9BILA
MNKLSFFTSGFKVEKKASLPPGDLSDMFTVPRAQTNTSSMFKNPQSSQFDRGLYLTFMTDSETSCDSESMGNCGSVKISISKDENLNLLTVKLVEASDLSAKREDGHPNPYFRVMLDVPCADGEERTEMRQQSKVYKNTSSPILNEDFYFQVATTLLDQCRLEIMVYDFDQFSVDECIGYCWLNLGRVSISSSKDSVTTFWAEVLPFSDESRGFFGEILSSITYLSKAQRLTVNIFKARNLRIESVDSQPAISVRVSLINSDDKRLKRKKTSIKKKTRNPQFNESLSFSVAKSCLCDISLEFEVLHEHGTFGMGSKSIGKMKLPLSSCKELWRAIIREEKSQARWYTLQQSS